MLTGALCSRKIPCRCLSSKLKTTWSRTPQAAATSRALRVWGQFHLPPIFPSKRGLEICMRTLFNRIASSLSLVLVLLAPTSAGADALPPPSVFSSDRDVTTLAMRWFAQMQAGRTDRSQYAPAYALQITDDAVKGMAHTLNRYGASPLHAEIVLTKKYGEQTFYEVKFVFPRGDSTSLLFGFDPNGKTTGVAIGSLAGD